MKRDFELIRAIMLRVEETPVHTPINNCLRFEEKDHLEIADHVTQLKEAGLIDALIQEDNYGPTGYVIFRITAQGHDFLASVRNGKFWNRVKAELEKRAIPFTVPFVLEFLKEHGKDIIRIIGGE